MALDPTQAAGLSPMWIGAGPVSRRDRPAHFAGPSGGWGLNPLGGGCAMATLGHLAQKVAHRHIKCRGHRLDLAGHSAFAAQRAVERGRVDVVPKRYSSPHHFRLTEALLIHESDRVSSGQFVGGHVPTLATIDVFVKAHRILAWAMGPGRPRE